jgi:hypothetical protein
MEQLCNAFQPLLWKAQRYGKLMRPKPLYEPRPASIAFREDIKIIFRKRSDHSRLGFALLLCYLRYPGRVLGADEMPPVTLVSFIGRQLGVNPAAFTRYSQRDQTRREQLAELMERLGYLSFDRASFRYYLAWLTPVAQNIRKADLLVEMLTGKTGG